MSNRLVPVDCNLGCMGHSPGGFGNPSCPPGSNTDPLLADEPQMAGGAQPYYSFLFDRLSGPVVPGTKLNDVGHDITLAKTFTDSKTPLLGNLTFFVEN